jgi:diacylglycerol kinase (ATP)
MVDTGHSPRQDPKRILIVCNPTAGRFRRGRLQKVKAALERRGCEVAVTETTRRGDAEALARLADPAKVDAVVAAGGDGTVGEVVNGLLGRNIPLGIIPLGTTNVLAAEIGLSGSPDAIAAVIAGADKRRCYLGLANGRIFMMMAGIGFDAHVVQNVSPGLKRLIGKAAYVWAAMRELSRHAPAQYRVTLDGRTMSAASIVIGNGRYYGGRYSCTPDARLDRPCFQVCLFGGFTRRATLSLVLALLRGTVPAMPDVTLIETDRLHIDGRPDDPVQGDGDIITRLPLDIRMAEQTIDILAPAPVENKSI